MSLSNLNKDNITNLFEMLDLNSQIKEQELIVESVRSNYSTYGKLELISRQIMMLKNEALNILENHKMNLDFANIECNFKKAPGSYYYVYEKNNYKFLSIIAPNEWNVIPGKFITKVLFDYDYNFYIVNE